MQIELAPKVEATLTEEASKLGLSPTQLSAKILTNHATQAASTKPAPLSDVERDRLFERHIAWLKESSPGWETRDPYAIDWQAFKAEGRKH